MYGDERVFPSVGVLVDGQRAADQRLGLDILGFAIKQPQDTQDPCRRACTLAWCTGCSHATWGERVSIAARTLWVADEAFIQGAVAGRDSCQPAISSA